ncbi:hypothetical protein JD844_013817, partial [Phrynosoma platyrhinos]
MGAKDWMTINEGGELAPESSEQLAPHMPTIWRATENIPGFCEERTLLDNVGQASGNRETIGYEDITEEHEAHRVSPRRAREDLSDEQDVAKASEKKQSGKPGDESQTTGAKSSSSE